MVRRTRAFLALCAVAALLLAAYLLTLRHVRGAPALSAARTNGPPAAWAEARASQRLFFRYTGLDAHHGEVAWIDTIDRHQPHFVESLKCEVVYVGGGRGICLSADRGVLTTYHATLFDARSFAVSSSFPLGGIPSRARVSVDGTLAAFTVFVSGHGYASLDFSTRSLIVEAKTGRAIADLEDFEVRREGAVIKAPDFNFWGITFTPDARQFFATLSSAGRHYLVRGDIASRRMEVVHENVECPSLSPDARHVAFKQRLTRGNRIEWRLHVLELASRHETELSELRSVDDQLEWLDDAHVLYTVPGSATGDGSATSVWVAPIDASSPPRLFLDDGYSPSVERCADPAACTPARVSN